MKVQHKTSKNYEWFKVFTNNRKISQSHIRELEKEFDTYGNITEISPITVNTHGFIIDGQHRFLICKKRELDVHYNEVDAKKDITPAMNSKQKRWSAMDYIDFFAAYKPEYEILRAFINTNGITFQVASAVLYSNLSRKFISDRRLKDGSLEVKPFIAQAQKNMDIVIQISEKMGSVLGERYVRGIVLLLHNDQFSLERFMKKLDLVMRVNPSLPEPGNRAIADVMRNLEAIYNFKSGDRSHQILFH